MNKTKTIKQYSGEEFSIGVTIKANGNIHACNSMQFYSETSRERNKIYNKSYKNKTRTQAKTIKQYADTGFYIGVSINADGTIKSLSSVHFYGETRRKYCKMYNKIHPENIKTKNKRYRKSHIKEITKQRKIYRKAHPEITRKWAYNMRARRKCWLLPKPINSYFDGAHLHHLHIDDDHRIAIYIPAELHNSIYHAYNKPETMNKINELAMEWYYDRNSRNY